MGGGGRIPTNTENSFEPKTQERMGVACGDGQCKRGGPDRPSLRKDVRPVGKGKKKKWRRNRGGDRKTRRSQKQKKGKKKLQDTWCRNCGKKRNGHRTN